MGKLSNLPLKWFSKGFEPTTLHSRREWIL
jgi:hypothetical protein